MMKNLLLEEGTKITVENVNLPVATFAKFQPQQMSFLDITNPKAVYPFHLTKSFSVIFHSINRLFQLAGAAENSVHLCRGVRVPQ